MKKNSCWALALFILFPFSVAAAPALNSYNVDKPKISVSGISSGAFMAVQMGVAFSSVFSGIGSIAGGVYSCAQGQASRALEQCMKHPETIHIPSLVQHTKNLAQFFYIDSTENIRNQKVYIFSSVGDATVNTLAGEKLKEFYAFFLPENQIQLQTTPHTAHGFPTLDQGGPCQTGALPWILNCNFDAASATLKHIYGNLNDRVLAVPENLMPFNQTEFGGAFASLEDRGWIYVPHACQANKKCKLHIALHGCQMNSFFIQDQFARTAGYNEWAENNEIIVLYPQALQNSLTNPHGCWDWFGYTGLNYATKYGSQMSALMRMILRVQDNTP